MQGKPTEASGNVAVKEYGQLDATDIVPGTEVSNAVPACLVTITYFLCFTQLTDLPAEEDVCGGEEESEEEESRSGGWFREEGSGQWVALENASESEGELELDSEAECEENYREGSKESEMEAESDSEVEEQGKESSFQDNETDYNEGQASGPVQVRRGMGLEDELEMEQQLPKEALERLKQERREKAALVGTTRVSTDLSQCVSIISPT